MTKELSAEKVAEIQLLSYKIDQATAQVQDYERYELLLLEAGFTRDHIRSKLLQNGYQSYEEYIKARKEAVTYQQKRVTEAIIAAALIGLAIALLFMVAQGLIKKR